MSKVIQCTCGTVIAGTDDHELLTNARQHATDSHPDWPPLQDDELLAMAIPAD